MSSIYMRETLYNAALLRPGARGSAGFISGSGSTTWGIDKIDLAVLYGPQPGHGCRPLSSPAMAGG